MAIEIRLVEIKYSGNINDYSLSNLEKMAWTKMEKRGDFTPDRIENNSAHTDGEIWIENLYPSNHLAVIGLATAAEMEVY